MCASAANPFAESTTGWLAFTKTESHSFDSLSMRSPTEDRPAGDQRIDPS